MSLMLTPSELVGLMLMQRLRTPGSSLVATSDLDHAWPMLQRHALEQMILDENLRPGGRGLADMRPASCQVIACKLAD